MRRDELLDELAGSLLDARRHRLIVGIDGRDGVGKTTLAADLAATMRSRDIQVSEASLDGFHHPRAHRYQCGADSAEGYWHHAFDLQAARRELLEPWSVGSGTWRPAVHDVRTDARLALAAQQVPRVGALLVDGVFLCRPELVELWDVLILLEAPLQVSQRRGEHRDGVPAGRKYAQAHEIYRASCDPVQRADIVVDATSLDEPTITRTRLRKEDP